ncbi:MAG TPA: RagB/SusD family nutrient uptake outer membrane protein [Gemmatimonadales bacterium]|nr:RagB/SusD family nutrient uptake outer membrane protein [Gemmatimonadales bacterium]
MNRNPRRALIAATLLTLAAGCTDTTELPTSTITDTNYFNDPSSYRAFLAKIYAGLAVSGQQGPAGNGDIQGIDEGFSQYLRLYWEAQELPTDEAVIAWGDVGLPELNTQLWASSNSFVVAMYYRVAYQVSLANEFLRQTSEAKLAERSVSPELRADIAVFRAEARFLRALSYWHGIDLFGNIPLVTEEYVLGSPPPAQTSRQELFTFVVNELNAIQADLPAAAGPGTYGRATKEAASMLLAKLYLNAEIYTGTPQYGPALAAVQAVIAGPFTLDPSYRHLFQADNHTSPEIIFPVIQDGLRTQTFGGTTFLVHAACGGTMDPNTYGVDGCWFGLRLKPEAYNRYAPDDPRRAYFWLDGQTVDVAAISSFSNGIPAPKFENVTSLGAPGSNQTHPDTDFPMFRLGDAYLMYAEAHLRGGGGDRAQALAYVNALRQRAYGSTAGDITDPELTLQFILDERGRELLWEAHRRTDLIRYRLFTGGDYLWAWKGGAAAGTATETFRDLYPLPASELTANPNLVQNPGY